jgi:O-antigen ligase
MSHGRAHDRVAFWVLAALLFVLPLIEVPKTVAAWLFILVSWWGAFSRNAGPRPGAFEWALLGVVAASLASTALNWPLPSKAKGLYDTAVYAAVGWGVYRRRWTDEESRWLATAAVAGVVVGVAWGALDVMRGREVTMKLRSVGMYPSSSIYLGIMLLTTLSLSVGDVRRRWWWRSVSGVLLIGLLLMGSRGGILAGAVAGGAWLLLVRPAKAWIVAAAVAAGVLVVAALPNSFQYQRAVAKVSALIADRQLDDSDHLRVTMWRLGAAQVIRGDSPWFGVGPRNFRSIDPSRVGVERPAATAGIPHLHAHNLFLTKAAEEGLVGLVAFVSLLALVAYRLFRDWRGGRARDWRWGAAWGALAVPVIAGSFNTPWYQEHALLAMIWFGLYMGSSDPGAASPVVENGRVEAV